MLVVANYLSVAEGYEEKFIDLFEQQVAQMPAQEGLQEVEILRPVAADQYVILSSWESREAFDRWRNSDDFQAAHANLPMDMFEGPNRLEIYEQAAKIEPEK